MLDAPLRPFFIAAALQALAVVAVGPLLAVRQPAGVLAAWHAHEMLFGYVPAVQAGVLLTAASHWTGRRPIAGAPVAALLALWLAGRLAIAVAGVGSAGATVLTTLFPAALALAVAHELVAGRGLARLPVVAVLAVLVVAQGLFHWEYAVDGRSVFGERLAIAAIMGQFMVLLGRLIPVFTHEVLGRAGALPAPFGSFDVAAVAAGVAALAAWIALPVAGRAGPASGVLLLSAGVLHLGRQARWVPHRSLAEPLVAVLHVGYGALPLGFLVAGAGVLADMPTLAFSSVHIWAIGGTAMITLALMTRASLAHTGCEVRALPGTSLLYGAIAAAVAARFTGVVVPAWASALMPLAGVCWIAAFGGFLFLYGPLLVRAQATGGAGAEPIR